jgi:hypothetical protein
MKWARVMERSAAPEGARLRFTCACLANTANIHCLARKAAMKMPEYGCEYLDNSSVFHHANPNSTNYLQSSTTCFMMSSLKKLWCLAPLGYPRSTFKVQMAIRAVNDLWAMHNE